MALYLKFCSTFMMTLKIQYLFVAFLHLSLGATDICVSQTPCKCVLDSSRTIDLTSVGSLIYPRFDELKVINSTDNGYYSYNPCHPFDSSNGHTTLKKGNVACIKSAACVKYPGGNDGQLPEEHSIGLQETAKFGQNTSPDSFHINYTIPKANQSLTVNLVCDKSVEHHLEIITPESATNFHVEMKLTSKCACINECKSEPPSDDSGGLSTGSQLLIVFFTILLAYLLVGILWNAFNGAKGSELIPNVDFWNELPKLILEGVLFTCSCFGRKSSYGEV